jgi:hypothetical protein
VDAGIQEKLSVKEGLTMYIYNDEDNAPMNDHLAEFDFHNPTVYGSRAEMLAIESGAYEEKEEHENGCWNCTNYDGNRCTKEWNNLDPSYYIDWRDDKKPDDYCDDWELEEGSIYEDFFGED